MSRRLNDLLNELPFQYIFEKSNVFTTKHIGSEYSVKTTFSSPNNLFNKIDNQQLIEIEKKRAIAWIQSKLLGRKIPIIGLPKNLSFDKEYIFYIKDGYFLFDFKIKKLKGKLELLKWEDGTGMEGAKSLLPMMFIKKGKVNNYKFSLNNIMFIEPLKN